MDKQVLWRTEILSLCVFVQEHVPNFENEGFDDTTFLAGLKEVRISLKISIKAFLVITTPKI